MQRLQKKLSQLIVMLLSITFLILPTNVIAEGKWWDVDPEEENPSLYYDSILIVL